MKVSTVNYSLGCQSPTSYYKKKICFKGAKEEILSEGLKEAFTEIGLPAYKALRGLDKYGKGDTKGAVKQGIGLVDNIVCQPVKQTIAASVSAKGALIGTAICPGVGTAIGATVGYLGTFACWGAARNKIVDEFMED